MLGHKLIRSFTGGEVTVSPLLPPPCLDPLAGAHVTPFHTSCVGMIGSRQPSRQLWRRRRVWRLLLRRCAWRRRLRRRVWRLLLMRLLLRRRVRRCTMVTGVMVRRTWITWEHPLQGRQTTKLKLGARLEFRDHKASHPWPRSLLVRWKSDTQLLLQRTTNSRPVEPKSQLSDYILAVRA